jgi:hypothetical protein
MIELPACPHRGEELARDRWSCRAPSLVVPSGGVSGDTCRYRCPLVSGARELPPSRQDWPLISCLMPTADRHEFAALAIRRFLAQDYPRTELLIIDDGDQPLASPLLGDPRIRYIRLKERASIGAKRNLACREAQGSILIHWDDDDWHGPARIRRQVEPLVAGRAEITGLADTLMLDLARLEFWQPSSEAFRRLAFAGVHCGTLAYRRSVSDELTCYPDVSHGEDVAFLRPALLAGCRVEPVPAGADYVYVRHGRNVSLLDDFHRRFDSQRVSPPPLVAADLPHYSRLAGDARAVTPVRSAPPATIHNLAVITTHFNPCGFRRPRESYDRFAAGIAAAGLPLWTAELAYDDDPFRLPCSEKTFRFRGTRERNLLWQKERLLNLLIARLPADVDAVAWIDADVLLLNPEWVSEAKAVLATSSVAQLFAESYDLLPDGRLERLENSTGWALAHGPASPLDFNLTHPGFAWAARRDLLRSRGLYDAMVTGSGDSMMVAGFAGQPLPPGWQLNAAWQTQHAQWVRAIAEQTGGNIGCVRGSLLHLWHGSRANRRYHERLMILTEHGFDPNTDVQVDAGGLWSWTDDALSQKPRMIQLVRDYFGQRREDD